jgi:polyhydroxybutyrate depolymerase
LVVMLHGGFGSADQAERSYGWNQLADPEKFMVAIPTGWAARGIARQGIDGAGHQWPGSQPVREGPTRLRAH